MFLAQRLCVRAVSLVPFRTDRMSYHFAEFSAHNLQLLMFSQTEWQNKSRVLPRRYARICFRDSRSYVHWRIGLPVELEIRWLRDGRMLLHRGRRQQPSICSRGKWGAARSMVAWRTEFVR